MWYERDTKRDGVAASQFGMRNGDCFCGIAVLVGRVLSLSKGIEREGCRKSIRHPVALEGGTQRLHAAVYEYEKACDHL